MMLASESGLPCVLHTLLPLPMIAMLSFMPSLSIKDIQRELLHKINIFKYQVI